MPQCGLVLVSKHFFYKPWVGPRKLKNFEATIQNLGLKANFQVFSPNCFTLMWHSSSFRVNRHMEQTPRGTGLGWPPAAGSDSSEMLLSAGFWQLLEGRQQFTRENNFNKVEITPLQMSTTHVVPSEGGDAIPSKLEVVFITALYLASFFWIIQVRFCFL